MAETPKTGDAVSDSVTPAPKRIAPHEREPKFRVLVNPDGGMIAFGLDAESEQRFEEYLVKQRPPRVKPRDWYREADPEELAAYMEESGHFFHEDDRSAWEGRQLEKSRAAAARAKELQAATSKRK